MSEYYQIKSSKELIDYLKTLGRDAILDTDYQLQTNCGWVHELDNGKIAFFTNNFHHNAILFDTKKSFEEVVSKDKFPIENLEGEIFDIDSDSVKNFHLQAEHYQKYLNRVLKFSFPEITKEAAQAYLKKVIGRSIKQTTLPNDILALISVIGELIKQETNGKWFLLKSYGTYNPIYEPNIVTAIGNVFLISSQIIRCVKCRTSKLENIFDKVHSQIKEHVKWENYAHGRDNLIILE